MQFNGKADQLAYIAFNDQDEFAIKRAFGLIDAEWVEDRVKATGVVNGQPGTNVAKLLFNYDLGIELEILRYIDGPNYAQGLDARSLCHVGFHADSDLAIEDVPRFPYPIIQQVRTETHTNEFVNSRGRTYRYTIFDSYEDLGHYLKVIERYEYGRRS